MDEEVIKLLDSSGTQVLDSVSTEYEDSFCLESFGDLAKAHQEADPAGTKSFIIARVQTWDHKQPEKAFYSYYNAFHLNKILFQTQVYLGKKLIHRLHVLNPLTNTDIVGNVLYFIVKKKGTQASISSIVASAPLPMKENEPEATTRNHELSGIPEHERQGEAPKSPMAKLKPRIPSKLSKIDTSVVVNIRPDLNIPKSATVKEIEKGNNQAWTLASPIVTEDKDDEDGFLSTPSKTRNAKLGLSLPTVTKTASLKREKHHELHSVSSTEPRVVTVNVSYTPITTTKFPTKTLEEHQMLSESMEKLRRTNSVGHGPISSQADSLQKIRRHTAVNIVTKPPSGPVSLGNHTHKTTLHSGVVTRFAVPVSGEEIERMTPRTVKGRRRTLSYANAVMATGKAVSVEEWKEMLKEERSLLNSAVEANTPLEHMDFDIVPDMKAESAHSTSPRKKTVASPYKMNLSTPLRTSTPLSPIKSEDSPEEKDANNLQDSTACLLVESHQEANTNDDNDSGWDALLFATDTDFLEQSKIRLIFKDNAINPEDAQLFKMPEYTGEQGTAPVIVEEQSTSFICELCYPSPARLREASLCVRLFHYFKCYILALLIMFGVFFFIFYTLKDSNSSKSSPRSTNVST